jgi:hypothetical protein
VNGSPVDLAYTYVHDGEDPGFTNLAFLVGCPASSVTRRLPWPPDGVHAGRLDAWLGTYTGKLTRLEITQYFDDPNGLAIQLDTPTEHPSMAATLTLSSYADIDSDPVSFATTLGACRVQIAQTDSGIVLTPSRACGGLLDSIAGPYRRL